VITEAHATILAEALRRLVGEAERGALVYLRCLPSEIVDGLAAEPQFAIPGFTIFAVTDREDALARVITADRAVELREDKGDPLLLIIDTRRAGAGLDGIYSAGREVTEGELFEVANGIARKRLGHGRIGFARDAVRSARRLGRGTSITPWQEFDFLVAASESDDSLGGAVSRLGLWPIAIGERPEKRDLDLSAGIVNRLLFDHDITKSAAARISGLRLVNPTREQLEGLQEFLAESATLDPLSAVRRLENRPHLWLNVLKPGFASDELQAIAIVPWRNDKGKLLSWSGLHESQDGKPKIKIDVHATAPKKASKLEARWWSVPDVLPKDAVTYQVDLMAADETLVSRTVTHKKANPQKAAFTAEDFEEFDESAKFEAFVRVSVLGRDDVDPQDTEEFLLEFGEAEGKAESTSGKVVRCLVEGAITLATSEEFREAATACPAGAHEDRKGFVAWHAPSGAGRTFKVLRPPLIAEFEQEWGANGGQTGRWRVQVRADGSRAGRLSFVPLERGDCPEEVWERALRAGQRLATEAAREPGMIARILAPPLPVVDEYVLAWAEALAQGPPPLSLVNTIEVQSLAGKAIGLIVMPLHPLRLAWHAAYDLLAFHMRYEEGVRASEVNRVLETVDSAHFPAMLPGLEPGQGFVFGDTLGFHAVAMVVDGDPEPKAAIAQMAACLAGGQTEIAPSVGARTADVLARELRHYLDCHRRTDIDGNQWPDLLCVHAYKAGDGRTVARSLGKTLEDLRASKQDDDGSEAGENLCFTLDLFPTPEQRIVAGRFLAEVGRRHRSGAGQVDRDDRWLLETVQRPGGVVMPRLRWARRTVGTELTPAHVSFTFNNFDSRLEAVATAEIGSEARPIHAYGLVALVERCVRFDDEPVWRAFVPPRTEGERHPATRSATDRLTRLGDAILRATACHLSGRRDAWPVVVTRLSREARESIDRLHRTSDWVVTVDRNACIEYFDSPREMQSVYDAYVIDCVPERGDLGSLQLITSTTNIEEVRTLLDGVLSEMGLSGSERNCRMLLDHLKALSGRLAIRLANPATRAGELVALALVHAHCLDAGDRDAPWPRLDKGFLVPLDEVADIVPLDEAAAPGGQRADLLYVSAGSRGPLEMRFVEVKYRRHLRTARDPQLISYIRKQLAVTRARWEKHFFDDALGSSGRAIRRSVLVRMLGFYLDKAHRHHLDDETYQRLRRQIDKLMTDGDGYGPVMSELPDVGFVFCPDLRTVGAELIGNRDDDEKKIYLFGPSLLPEVGIGGLATSGYRPPDLTSSAASSMPTDVDDEEEGSAEESAASSPPSNTGTEPVNTEPDAALAPVAVILGRNVATGEDVQWRVSIKGNPHLMVLGLPGMGKTTSLITICRQLATAGINPIVFSYHHDIDERLAEVLGDVESVDYHELGFNPLEVDPASPLAHIDAASELRDIFAAIFPDLGDLQTEKIRQAIRQSYLDQGWGKRVDPDVPPPTPSFQEFFNILAADPKPNAGLMARLNELNDYGFFSSEGNARSLLEIHRPVVVRIHRTSSEVLQRAFASFVLYSVYKEMFRRGLQPHLTHAVVFDEAHRASRLKLLPTMAKECRKYGLALVVASQEARDFDRSLYSAIASYLALRVTENNARVIARLLSISGMERRMVDRLKGLPKFHALYFTEGESRPIQVALTP